MKTVSVIIPAKNEAAYLKSCLESLLALKYPKNRYEIIVADNGSTDETVAIAESYKVKIVRLPKEKTISAVRNGGASQASGDILVFLDADCTVAPDWLTQAQRYFFRDDVACFGSSPVIPENATWVEQTWFLVRKSHKQVFEREWQESTNMFIPRKIFELSGGFDEKLITCEDVDLSYRLLKYGKIISDTRIVAVHHRDPKTLRGFFLKERWRGKSNYAGLLRHGLRLTEIPSLLLPVYFILMLTTAFITLFVSVSLAIFIFLLAELPILLLSWIKIRHEFSVVVFVRLIFLYNIYFIARSLSIFPV